MPPSATMPTSTTEASSISAPSSSHRPRSHRAYSGGRSHYPIRDNRPARLTAHHRDPDCRENADATKDRHFPGGDNCRTRAAGALAHRYNKVAETAQRSSPAAGHPGCRGDRRARRRADLSVWRRHRHCLQHSRRPQPNSRTDHPNQFQGRTGRAGGRPARADRSRALPSSSRPDDRRARPRSGPAEIALDNLDRYTKLLDKGWATQQLADTQKAQVAQLQNAVKGDEALVQAAKVQLQYTKLTSSIDGVTGIRQIDVGNVIHPTDPNGLVVVTQIAPIAVIFTLPEGDLPNVQQQMAKGRPDNLGLQPGQQDQARRRYASPR